MLIELVARSTQIAKSVMNRYSEEELKSIMSVHAYDIKSLYAMTTMAAGNSDVFWGGIHTIFMLGFSIGQDSMKSTDTTELKAAKERLTKLTVYGSIGVYDADQLIEDIKLVLEAIK